MEKNNRIALIPLTLLILGIIVRLAYVNYFGFESHPQEYMNYSPGNQSYTHDLPNHIQYIQFVANNLSLPEVDKSLEYPQQPLYYLIMGFFYRILEYFFSSVGTILGILVWFSAFFSIGALIFAYFLTKRISKSVWIQSFIIGLFAFTPAFVYQAGMIGNDPLSAFLSAGTFFFLVCYIQEEKTKNIIASIFLSVLSVFTKISGGIIVLTILLALFYKYKNVQNAIKQKTILTMIYFVFLVGFLCLGVALYRAYVPSTGEFRFVESYSYENQQTDPTRLSYFLNFNLTDLLKEGESYVYGNENVARTLPTFLYGSFLFGEYSYQNITDKWPIIKTLMQFIIILGLLFPFGIIINLFFIKKWSIIDYISAFAVAINLVLIISFLFRYPSVANSDFRYFAPSFL